MNFFCTLVMYAEVNRIKFGSYLLWYVSDGPQTLNIGR